MKHLLTLAILTVVTSVTGAKTLRLGDLAPLTKGTVVTSEKPSFDISVAQDSMSATFTVKLLTVDVNPDNELYPSTYWWTIDNFSPSMTPGEASLPQRALIFQLPGNAENVSLTENYTRWQTISGYTPTPARPPLLMGSDESYTLENVPVISKYTPADTPVAEIFSITRKRNSQVAYVHLKPFRYGIAGDSVNVCYEFSYTLNFDKSEAASTHRRLNKIPPIFRDTTIKIVPPIPVDTIPRHPFDSNLVAYKRFDNRRFLRPSNYLFVTTHDNYQAISQYARWKKMLGHNCRIVATETWSKELIKSTIDACYAADTALQYVIFAGPVTDIPAYFHEFVKENGVTKRRDFSDFPYAVFNSDYESPDTERSLFTGRFLVDDPSQMWIITSKQRRIHRQGAGNTSFHKRAAHVGYFGHDNDPETDAEGYYMVCTSLEAYNQALSHDKAVTRLYYKKPHATPKYWYDRGGHKQLLPEDLIYPGFAWDADSTDVTRAFNAGHHYIFTYAHGSVDKWSDNSSNWNKPVFASRQMGMLHNEDKLPHVFSVSCFTGSFNEPDGMANTLLKSKNGACCVVASPTELMCAKASLFGIGLFRTIWSKDRENEFSSDPDAPINLDPNMFAYDSQGHRFIDEEWYTMGNIVENAIKYERIISNDAQPANHLNILMHIYGDPGIFFNTETPVDIRDVYFSRNNKYFKSSKPGDYYDIVSLSLPEQAIIGVYNETTDSVARYYAKSIEFLVEPTDKYHVVITQHNKIPLEFHVDKDRIQATGPYVSDTANAPELRLQNVVQKSPDTVEATYSFDASESAEYSGTLSIRDMNNNTLATTEINEQSGTIVLSSPGISNGIYVVTAQAPAYTPAYHKLLIR